MGTKDKNCPSIYFGVYFFILNIIKNNNLIKLGIKIMFVFKKINRVLNFFFPLFFLFKHFFLPFLNLKKKHPNTKFKRKYL